MTDRRGTIIIIAVLAAGLAARLLFCYAVVGFDAPLRGDEIDYHAIAANIVKGEGFAGDNGVATALRPPLWPVLMSGIYRIVGQRYNAVRLFQVLLGVAAVYLVYLLGRRLFSRGAALVAALLAACNPFLIFSSGYLLTENLYMILALLSIILYDRLAGRSAGSAAGIESAPAADDGMYGETAGGAGHVAAAGAAARIIPPGRAAAWTAVAAGLTLGLACLTRPTAFPFALATAAFLAIAGAGPRTIRLRRSAILLVAAVIVIAPWSIRNRIFFGETVLFTTHGGITFYQGNNDIVFEEPGYHGGVAPLNYLPGWEELAREDEVARDRHARRLGMQYLKRHPGRIPTLMWRRLRRTWRLRSDMGLSGVQSGWWWNKDRLLGRIASSFDAGLVYSVVVLPLFLFGFVSTLRLWRRLLPLYGLIAVHTLVALTFFGSLRMRIPIEPVIALFAAAGFFRIAGGIRRYMPRSVDVTSN